MTTDINQLNNKKEILLKIKPSRKAINLFCVPVYIINGLIISVARTLVLIIALDIIGRRQQTYITNKRIITGFNKNIINETTRRGGMDFINLEDLKSVKWEPPIYCLVTLLDAGCGNLICDDGTNKHKSRNIQNQNAS